MEMTLCKFMYLQVIIPYRRPFNFRFTPAPFVFFLFRQGEGRVTLDQDDRDLIDFERWDSRQMSRFINWHGLQGFIYLASFILSSQFSNLKYLFLLYSRFPNNRFLLSGPFAMNIVLLSTDLVTASRFDAKFDKTKPRPYNCNAFIIKSMCVVCDVQ